MEHNANHIVLSCLDNFVSLLRAINLRLNF